MSTLAPLIRLEGIQKSYRRPDGESMGVLEGLDLEIFEGEFLVLLGPSGCGKSTLLDLILGQQSVDGGSIEWSRRPDFAAVWQEDFLMPWKTVAENITFPLVVKGLPREERRRRVDAWLARVDLEGFGNHYPSQLSQGMQKRVALAAAFVGEPRVVLMDEPFGALDVSLKLQIQESLLALWEAHRFTVVMVTHDVQEAALLADRVALFAPRPSRVREIRINPLPRPRRARELYGQQDFHEFARELWVAMMCT